MAKLFFYDCETSGKNFWQHGIHQISGVIEIDGVVREEFNIKTRINPAARIDDEALKIGNVTMEQIAAYPPMGEQYKLFTAMTAKYVHKFNKKDKFFLVGYNNASFDDKFLRAWFIQNQDEYFGSWFWSSSIDVMVLAANFFKDKRHLMEDFQLKTVAKALGLVVDETKLHDAIYDVRLTMDMYKILNSVK